MNIPFGTYLAKLRTDRGWSQRTLAILAGCTNAEISRIESGEYKQPTLAMLEKLSYALGVPLLSLIDAAGYDIGLVANQGGAEVCARIPIIRRATALLQPVTQEANIVGYATVDSSSLLAGDEPGLYYLVAITDDTMSDAGMIPHRSHVLVRRQFTAHDGDIVLVAVGSEDAAFRVVEFQGERAVLTATNPAVLPRDVPIATAHILGLAVEVRTCTRLVGNEEGGKWQDVNTVDM